MADVLPVDLPWFWAFVDRHQERLPRADWPEPESAFWSALRALLGRHAIAMAVADAASELMVEAPPHLDHHHEVFLACVRQVWAEAEVPADSVAQSRPAPTDDNAAWNAAARRHWDRLDEPRREHYRALVRAHFPGLAHNEPFVRLSALAWAFDLSFIPTAPAALPPSSPARGIAAVGAALGRLLRRDTLHAPAAPNVALVAGQLATLGPDGRPVAQDAPGRNASASVGGNTREVS